MIVDAPPMSADQVEALSRFRSWLRLPSKEFRLGGLAGTGKTTLIKAFVDILGEGCEVITPTAKAAEVLKRKGVFARTSHNLLCHFEGEISDETGRIQPVFSDRKGVSCRAIIIDEASMVTSEMRSRILRGGRKVIWVGDYGQLRPVEKNSKGGVLTEDNLDAKLTVQHRHGNAREIIDFAMFLRENGKPVNWKPKTPDSSIVQINPRGVRGTRKLAAYCQEQNIWPVIFYTNNGVDAFNAEVVRQLHGDDPDMVFEGQKIVCIENNYAQEVANGELMEISDVRWCDDTEALVSTVEGSKSMRITFDRNCKSRGIVKVQNGYALTCHKAQGSEWERIAVVEDCVHAEKDWRYTGATRSSEMVTYFTNGMIR